MSMLKNFVGKGFKSKIIASNVDKFSNIKKVIGAAALAVSCALSPVTTSASENNVSIKFTFKDGKFQMIPGGAGYKPINTSPVPKLRPDDLLAGYQMPDAFSLLQINSQMNTNAGVTRVNFPTKEQCMDILVATVQPWYSEGRNLHNARMQNDMTMGQNQLQQQFVNILQNKNKLELEELYFIDTHATNRIGCFKM